MKGKLSLEGAQTRLVPSAEADGKTHVFEVLNTSGESMQFSCDSDQTVEVWRNAIQSVVYDESKVVHGHESTVEDLLVAIDAGKEEEA